MQCFHLIHVGLLEVTVSVNVKFYSLKWVLTTTACKENKNSAENRKLFGLFLSSDHKVILIQEPNLSI